MAETSKYDIMLSDLGSIEGLISTLLDKYNDIYERNIELEMKILEISHENEILLNKLSKIEEGAFGKNEATDSNLFNSLTLEERESLKVKLQSLISKIDYHISS